MNTDWFSNTVAVALLIGQIVVFLPQFIKIYRWGHSVGHHPLFMFMGHLASMLAWINAIIYYIYSWNNCQGTEWSCLANVYGLIFYFVQWIFWVFWYIFYISFLGPSFIGTRSYPEIEQQLSTNNFNSSNYACRWQSDRTLVYIGFLMSLMIGLGVFIRTLLLIQTYQIENLSLTQLIFPEPLLNWSYFVEIITTILFAFCYLPQLYEVVRLGEATSYSLVSLALMIPSNVIWTIFLANWSFLTHYELIPINPTLNNITIVTNRTHIIIPANSTDFDHSPKIFNMWLPYLIMLAWQIIILAFGVYYTYYFEIIHGYRRVINYFWE